MTEEKSGPHELHPLPIITAAEGLIGVVGSASRRTRRIPLDALAMVSKMLPGGAMLRRPLALTESILRQVLQAETRTDGAKFGVYPGEAGGANEELTAPPDARSSVRAMVLELLDRSVRQSPQQAREANYKRLLLQLVPDEVRIINVLSDGVPRPVLHVGVGSPGSVDQQLLKYATTVGTDAGIRLPAAATSYVAHLESLGLVDIGPEDESLREQYEILQTYDEVEAAEGSGSADSFMAKLKLKSPKFEKHTITLSELGRDLWNVADPDTHKFQVPDQRDDPTSVSD